MYRIHTRSLLISDVATYIALYVCYICTRARERVFANDETEISKFSPYMSLCYWRKGLPPHTSDHIHSTNRCERFEIYIAINYL